VSKKWIRQLPSLRSWELKNFKAVVDADIPLAPLTLVVGANSAGKSTLLQSILLMAQAADQRTPGTFPLNGTLVGLGKFEEAHSDFRDCLGEPIKIGGSVAMPYSLRRSMFFYVSGEEVHDGVNQGEDENLISWNVYLQDDPESSGAVIGSAAVTLTRGAEELGTLSAFLRPENLQAPPMLESQRSIFGDRYLMKEYVKERATGEDVSDLLRFRRSAGIAASAKDFGAVCFQAGIPVNGLIETDEVSWFLERVKQEASDFFEFLDDEDRPKESELDTSKWAESDAIDRLYALLKEQCIQSIEARRNQVAARLDFADADTAIVYSLIGRSDYSDLIYPKLKKRLAKDVGGSKVILDDPSIPAGMRSAAAQVPEFLAGSVLYLGPLREDPRVTYPHALAGSTHMPLGRKGESTASFLLQNTSGRAASPVGRYPYPLPLRALRYPMPSGEDERVLEVAVNAWVKEFGLGDVLGVQDEARYGVGFTIDKRDLTSVGTGVSQVLPVLVLCLMAHPGQLILLEQPELHLNPALQQKLADFFLEVVKTGRQLIVETHSEYMVTRLRRRVAEDSSGEVRSLFNFVFAEQDESRRTKFEPLNVGVSGALDREDWPSGFFDQAGNDVEAIMKAALGRRRKQAE
jgi:predicted ATPase